MVEAGLGFAWLPAVVGFVTAFLVAMTNWALAQYLFAITGKDDAAHHRPTAIALSAALFIALILLYATIFGIEMPALFRADSKHVLSWYESAVKAFYYSVVTITTLGYGDVLPSDALSRATAALEALNGLVTFGIFTGAITTFFAAKNSQLA